jgi:hypothetical protein
VASDNVRKEVAIEYRNVSLIPRVISERLRASWYVSNVGKPAASKSLPIEKS